MWGVPHDYKGLGLVDHMSSGDRDVCMCELASVCTGMQVLACQYMLIRQKHQRGLLCVLHRPRCSEENRKTELNDG